MTHRSFAETVISGASLSHDSFQGEFSHLQYIRNVLLKPFGRGYAGQWWQGRQRPTGVPGHRLQRMREDDGFHFFSSDDREYHEPRGMRERSVLNAKGVLEPQQVEVGLGWRRLTPKYTASGLRAVRSGRERRTRLRMERQAA